MLINLLEVVSLNVLLSQFITFMQILQIVAKSSVYIHILVRFNLNSVLLNAKIAFMEILLQKNVKLVEPNVLHVQLILNALHVKLDFTCMSFSV